MLNLFIMRHANCDFNEDIVNDFNREISNEGKKKSNLVLKELIKKKIKFDIVHTSPSKRTLQTLEIFKQQYKFNNTQIYEDHNLYDGSLENYLLKLSNVKNHYKNILIITHEPNIYWLVDYFNNQNDKKYQNFLKRKFLSSSVLKLFFNVDSWSDISGTTCNFDFFLDPNYLISNFDKS